MGVIVIVFATFLFIPAILLLVIVGRSKQGPVKVAETLNTKPSRLSQKDIDQRKAGNSVLFGTDLITKQAYYQPERIRPSTTAVVGRTGMGKTTLVIASTIDSDISKLNVAVVVIDGQRTSLTDETIALCKHYNRPYVVYPAAGFNPLGGWGSPEERAEGFINVVKQLGGTPTSDAGKFFGRQAERILRRSLPVLERYGTRAPTLRELNLFLTNGDLRQATLEAIGDCTEARDYYEAVSGIGEKDWAASVADVCGMIDSILVGDRKRLYCDTEAISLEEHIEAKKVIIIREGGYKGTTDNILGLMFMIRLQEYARLRGDDEDNFLVSVVVDESYMYWSESYPSFLAQCRKTNIAQTILFQSFEQFAPYQALLTASCLTWVILPVLTKDAKFVAEEIGQRLHEFTSNSNQEGAVKGSETHNYSYDYLMQPHHISELRQGQAIIISQDGRQRDVTRKVKLVPKLNLKRERYQEPKVAIVSLPELMWDQVRQIGRTFPREIGMVVQGQVGAVGENVNEGWGDDWLVDNDGQESA